MKVSGKNHVINLEAYIQNANASGKIGDRAKKLVKETATEEEKVQLSSKARDIQRVKKVLDSVPEVRQDKVTELKNSIENETYNVKGEKVAPRIVKESLLDEIL
ncbi:MAG: flagellar biosynthesis anti-sigma factor FlgM [Pseudomonadota bacterium]